MTGVEAGRPETRYVDNDGVGIAYQVFGSGPVDIAVTTGWVPGMASHWEDPAYARFLRRLGAIGRVVLWDKRGTGQSDRFPADQLPTLEERVQDLSVVLDAAGIERAALVGFSEGAQLSAVFAATNPDRVSLLVLYGGWAVTFGDDDAPGVGTPEAHDWLLETLRSSWGHVGSDILRLWTPTHADDPAFVRQWNRAVTLGASPGAATAWLRLTAATDIRPALPAISAPTLVLHRAGDVIVPAVCGRYLAEKIPGARWVELEGVDHLWWLGDSGALLDEVEEFLTGARGTREHDRVLATVLFTDIADSTRRASDVGDARWRELLESHDALVRAEVARFGGREVKHTGDGFLAAFDGPARGIRCAVAAIDRVHDELGLDLRAGLHAGECELIGDDLGGLAVHIGARVGALAEPGEVLVSQTVKDLVAGSGIEFNDRGTHELKGVPGSWRVFGAAG